MIKAEKKDKQKVTDILTDSFFDNRSVNYVIPQDQRKREKIEKLMAYSFDVCHAFGEVYLSDCRRACALVLYPEKKRTTLQSIWWDLQLAATVFGLTRTFRVLNREQLIRKHHPSFPFFYLWFIGVERNNQHAGIGRQLMQELLQLSQQQQKPVYLETSTPENVPWYQQFGFEVYAEESLSYKLYFLRK
ncbi:MAG: GNAT family N-acetyltransferase [Pseudobacter sp.]|uniref:GNAT family N-acetyltransferase n=1 Tax=Pseudobacter sp. TaxID=2045420 RepID=UPI003F7EBD1F